MARVIETGKPSKSEVKEKTNAERDGVSDAPKAPEEKPKVKLFDSGNKGNAIFECYIGHKTRGPKEYKEVKCAHCSLEATVARLQYVIAPRPAKPVDQAPDRDGDR